MSWRLAFHSAKVLLSYVIPYKVKLFRDAIIDGNIDQIRLLATERPRLLQQAIDADGNTAVGLSVMIGNVEVLKTILSMGSNPNISNYFDGNHPLITLAKSKTEENPNMSLLVDVLLENGSDPLQIVSHQADSAARFDATQTPWFHENSLLCTIRYQNEELLSKFVEFGVDVNRLDQELPSTPLMVAAALGYERMCQILLDAGANPNLCDQNGNTPLHLAVQGFGDKQKLVKLFLDHNARTDLKNDEGLTPLMLAKRLMDETCITLLEESNKTPSDSEPQPSTNILDQIDFSFS